MKRHNRWYRALAVVIAILCGTACSAHTQKFDVVSIRPSAPGGQLSFDITASGFHARNTPLFWIIAEAYFQRPLSYWRSDRLLNAPAWVMNEPYDIDARVDEETAQHLASLTDEEQERRMRPLLQQMLSERFHAVVQNTEAEATFYALTAPSHHLKTQPPEPTPAKRNIPLPGGGSMSSASTPDRHGFRFTHVSMPVFAEVLSGLPSGSDAPIEDRTHLDGAFDFILMKLDADTSSDPARPTEWDLHALGLRLERAKGILPALKLQHIEKPTPN